MNWGLFGSVRCQSYAPQITLTKHAQNKTFTWRAQRLKVPGKLKTTNALAGGNLQGTVWDQNNSRIKSLRETHARFGKLRETKQRYSSISTGFKTNETKVPFFLMCFSFWCRHVKTFFSLSFFSEGTGTSAPEIELLCQHLMSAVKCHHNCLCAVLLFYRLPTLQVAMHTESVEAGVFRIAMVAMDTDFYDGEAFCARCLQWQRDKITQLRTPCGSFRPPLPEPFQEQMSCFTSMEIFDSFSGLWTLWERNLREGKTRGCCFLPQTYLCCKVLKWFTAV